MGNCHRMLSQVPPPREHSPGGREFRGTGQGTCKERSKQRRGRRKQVSWSHTSSTQPRSRCLPSFLPGCSCPCHQAASATLLWGLLVPSTCVVLQGLLLGTSMGLLGGRSQISSFLVQLLAEAPVEALIFPGSVPPLVCADKRLFSFSLRALCGLLAQPSWFKGHQATQPRG